jgi:2,3-dihydro-2,3-dihydroxybenzoate dehydrogenase
MTARGNVLITGAGSGIGRATALFLAQRGYGVALCDRDHDALASLAHELSPGDVRCAVQTCDVRDPSAVEAAVGAAERALGPLDALAHAAGVLLPGALLDADADALASTLAVNVAGVLHVLQSVGWRMRERGRGAIVTVASNAAGTPRMGMGLYAASKAAASMLTRSLGLELAAHGVRCNVVCPGSTRTPMLTSLWQRGGSEQETVLGALDRHRLGIPLGRVAEPDDVARVISFLLSEDARHITLQEVYVDGGATL